MWMLSRAQWFINRSRETSFLSASVQHKQLEINPVAKAGCQQGLGRTMEDYSDQQKGVNDRHNVFPFGE